MDKRVGVIVALVVLGVCLPSGVSGSSYPDKEGAHKISRGARKTLLGKAMDLHLYHENFKVDSKWLPFPSVQTQDVCYPGKGVKQAKFTITAFSIADTGKGGLAYVKKDGGVGKSKLCFHLKSRRGHGYDFQVDIFGEYKKD